MRGRLEGNQRIHGDCRDPNGIRRKRPLDFQYWKDAPKTKWRKSIPSAGVRQLVKTASS